MYKCNLSCLQPPWPALPFSMIIFGIGWVQYYTTQVHVQEKEKVKVRAAIFKV